MVVYVLVKKEISAAAKVICGPYLRYFGNTSTSVDMEIPQAQFSTLTTESWLVKTLAVSSRAFSA